MKQHDMATFAKTLLEVAPELAAYGLAIRAAAEQGLPMPDFEWSTYCLEAQGSIYDLLKADGEIT